MDRKPSDYLSAVNFRSGFDAFHKNNSYFLEQYRKAKEIGKEAHHVFIMSNGCWGAAMNDGSRITSYEKIGYHAGTSHFWQGILDSQCPIVIYSFGQKTCVRGDIDVSKIW